MGQYGEHDSYLAMGKIAVGREYFSIPWYNCITKAHSIAAATVDDNHEPDVIGGYAISG